MKSAEFMQWVAAIHELDHHQRKLLGAALSINGRNQGATGEREFAGLIYDQIGVTIIPVEFNISWSMS